MSGNCRVDSDCAGGYCSPSPGLCGTATGYYCHTAKDTCVNDSDCGKPSTSFENLCAWSAADGRWECTMMPICS
jgi:hypothetical protein